MDSKPGKPRIFVAVPCHNRKTIAEQCLPTMRDSMHPDDWLALYNDGSVEYDAEWLYQFLPVVGEKKLPQGSITSDRLLGIQAQRRMHLRNFLAYEEMTHIYLSDHDVLVDPTWRENALRLQAEHSGAPLCLYNTQAHARIPGNTIEDDPASNVIWRRVAPGVSYLLTREHVESIKIETLEHFDWQIPAMLGGRFAVSRVGYIDHIGYGGQRHPPEEGFDGGDRVLAPTQWLIDKRAEVVNKLSK